MSTNDAARKLVEATARAGVSLTKEDCDLAHEALETLIHLVHYKGLEQPPFKLELVR